MKRWLLIIAGGLVLLIVVVLVAGALLPEQHHASRTLATKQSPQAIWDTINDHANEPAWRSDVASVTALGERNGKPVWKESYKDGNTLELATTESKPPTRMVREIAEEGPFSGRWEIDIQPTSAGSNVTITELGSFESSSASVQVCHGHTTQMEKYLTGLAGKFGEPASLLTQGKSRKQTARRSKRSGRAITSHSKTESITHAETFARFS